jgi:peptidoglycan/LPS O-acetylase OafA/YrhL
VLPFLIRILSTRGITLVAIGAIGLALVSRTMLVMHGNATHGPYTLLPCRADDLGMGALLAIICRNGPAWSWLTAHRRHMLTMLLLLGLGVLYLALHPAVSLVSTIGYSWIGLFYCMLILILVVHPGAIARGVFCSWMLTRLGKYSYAIYIFHYGIFGLSHYFISHHAPVVHDRGSLLVTLLALILTISCAAISWRFMESPLIARAGQRFRYVYDPRNGIPDVGCDANLARPSVSRGT